MNTQERLKILAAIADGEQRGLAEALTIYCPDWIPAAGNAGVPNREYTATKDPRWRKVSILVAHILTRRQVETASILRLAELFNAEAISVPQFTVPFTKYEEKNGETKYTEIKFSNASEVGRDCELTDDEQSAFERVVEYYGSAYGDDIPDGYLLAQWWHEFLKGPLRNVRIGTDEFRRSRAGLIPFHELLSMADYAGVQPAHIGNHSLVELLDLMLNRCMDDHDRQEAALLEISEQRQKLETESVSKQLDADQTPEKKSKLPFGLTLIDKTRVSRIVPILGDQWCDISNRQQRQLFDALMKGNGKIQAEVVRQLGTRDYRAGVVRRLCGNLGKIQLTIEYENGGFYVLKEILE